MLQYNFRHPEEVPTTTPACANNSVLVFLVFCCRFVHRPHVKASPGGDKMLVLPFPPFFLPFSFFYLRSHLAFIWSLVILYLKCFFVVMYVIFKLMA